MGDWARPLSDEEAAVVDAARAAARIRYEGRLVPHRSCGIALAETFGRPTAPYQSLRRGGLTGRGECGTATAGRLLLGELLGDPDPGGPVTVTLRAAVTAYEARWDVRTATQGCRTCNTLTGRFGAFHSDERATYCAGLAEETAGLLAETLLRVGAQVDIVPVPALESECSR